MRHDEVEAALYRSALIMGFQAVRQPVGLDISSDLRPDLVVILPGRRILTDVAIVHPLTLSKVRDAIPLKTLGAAMNIEGVKRRKYLKLNNRHQMELLPFVVETCGGMGPAAVRLLKAMARASQEQLSMWPKWDVMRHVVGSVAMAAQRGGAMAYLEGYDRALTELAVPSTKEKQTRRKAQVEVEEGEEEAGGEEGLGNEAEEEEEEQEVEEEGGGGGRSVAGREYGSGLT